MKKNPVPLFQLNEFYKFHILQSDIIEDNLWVVDGKGRKIHLENNDVVMFTKHTKKEVEVYILTKNVFASDHIVDFWMSRTKTCHIFGGIAGAIENKYIEIEKL